MGDILDIELGMVAAFMIGLLGSTHCIGMCGGIVGALTMGLPEHQRSSAARLLPWLLSYNAGRLLSYSLAGFLLGLLSASGSQLLQMKFPVGGLVGALFMMLLGIYIAGWYPTMQWLERAGGVIWNRLEPLGKRILPVTNHAHAFGLGVVWGWLPCGLVYSSLAWAATSANAWNSAMLMLAFGLGTLPMLLMIGSLAESLRRFTRHQWTRIIAGSILILFGVLMLVKITRMVTASGMPAMH